MHDTLGKMESAAEPDRQQDQKQRQLDLAMAEGLMWAEEEATIWQLQTLAHSRKPSGSSPLYYARFLRWLGVEHQMSELEVMGFCLGAAAVWNAATGKVEHQEHDEEEETMQYMTIWRNKFLTKDAKSLGDMAQALEAAAHELRKMEADGVTLELEGVEDDYAMLVTTDPAVARKYGFKEEAFDDEDFDGEMVGAEEV